MNILMINYEYPPIGGGGGVFTRDLAAELSKTCKIDIITTVYSGSARRETTGSVTVHRVPVLGRTSAQTATMLSMISFLFTGTLKGISLCLRGQYDIIHTHFAVPTGPVGMALSALFKIPNILNIYGGDIYDPSKKLSPHRSGFFRWAVRGILNTSSAVIAESMDIKNNALKYYSPKKGIDIIPLGIPEPSFRKKTRKELSLREDRRYIIAVGRFIERKRFDDLIKALSVIRRQGIDAGLILIGDGPKTGYLTTLAKELSLNDHVSFVTNASDEEKFQYLRVSDMYALSSSHEGFGIVLLEAMSSGLPIVATNNGGQTDILTDGVNAILTEPFDPSGLASGLIRLLNDKAFSRTMSDSNRDKMKEYSIEATAKKYRNFFDNYMK
jgi:glycosyltransferase involved in cell wall biosynthesis